MGFVLALLGGLLAIVGALLLVLAAPKLVAGMAVKSFVWGIFGLLLAVGLSFLTAGLWQIMFGKRSQSLMTFVFVLVIILLLFAVIGRRFLVLYM